MRCPRLGRAGQELREACAVHAQRFQAGRGLAPQDDGGQRRLAAAAELLDQRQAIGVAQAVARDDQVGRASRRFFQRLGAVAGFDDMVAGAFQGEPDHSPRDRVVLDHKDRSGTHSQCQHWAEKADLSMR
jgi:hypothetical protein